MGSEEQVLELMMLLDEGLLEATKLEEKLDEYDHKLQVQTCNFFRPPLSKLNKQKTRSTKMYGISKLFSESERFNGNHER